MKRAITILWLPGLLLMLTALACITINVYFPEAEIKDMSRAIEKEVARQAEEAVPTPAEAPPESGEEGAAETSGETVPQTSSLLQALLGGSVAYAAQDVPDPGVSNPAIRQIIKSRAARVNAINRYKDKGAIGENNQGLIEARNLGQLKDLKQRAEVQRLVKDENADRNRLYQEIAAETKVDASQIPRVKETYAATLRNNAKPGHWIQMPDGSWKQK